MIVTLLTDYGAASEHVGVLHALLARDAAAARVIDLAHDIAPGDVRAGSVILGRVITYCPVGVHVTVVDPGVGGDRRAVALCMDDGRVHVGPDNGVLLGAAPPQRVRAAVVLGDRWHGSSATFDGRDVFVPAAVALVNGEDIANLGRRLDPHDLVRLPPPDATVRPGSITGEIVCADHFGNVELALGVDALREAALDPGAAVWVSRPDGERRAATVARTFRDVPVGQFVVLIDSHGHLAVSVNRGNAALFTGQTGTQVTIERR